MARPTKQTVDYFPHYVHHKKTIPLLKSKFGSDGYAVFMQTLEILGKSKGHFFDFSDEIDWLFFVSEMGVSEDTTREILFFSVRLKAFDKELFDNQIIWSENFVENLKPLYAKRKVELPLRPKVIPHEAVNDTDNEVNDTGNPQSKVKKSKVKKSINTVFEKTALDLKEIALLRKTNKKITDAIIKTWVNTIRLMVEKDGVDIETINKSLTWYRDNWNGEFIPVIESAKSLREKWDKLINAIKRNDDGDPEIRTESTWVHTDA